ncbi:MAG: hypothetical protein AAGI38_19395 [Bacteroidota bacterium]
MKHLLISFLVLAIVCISCKKDEEESPNMGLSVQPGSLTMSITSGGNTESFSGEATYRGSSGFIDNTTRHIFDLELNRKDEKVIINLIYDNTTTSGEIETGAHECGRLTPINSSNFNGRIAETYMVNSDTYKWIDNPGRVTVVEADDPQFTVEFDFTIINDVTGNFDRFQGSFVSKER